MSHTALPETMNPAAYSTPAAKAGVQRNVLVRRISTGTFLGLTWGAALRAWMAVLALEMGETPQFTWEGTFAAILLPAALVGAILGGAACFAETSSGKRWRWAILAPLLLAVAPAILLEGFIEALMTDGLGGGAIAVALIGLLGGYAVSGFGAKWTRWVSGLLAAASTLAAAYGLYFGSFAAQAQPSAGKAFGALFFVLLMAVLVLGINAPARYVHKK